MSHLEDTFEAWLQTNNIEYKREYKFVPKRRFRADFYIPAINCLVEIEGGVWTRGRHNRPKGFINDCEKYNLATVHGYKVLRFTSEDIRKCTYGSLEAMLEGL